MKRLAFFTAIILLTLSAVAVLIRFPEAIIMLAVSIFIAAAVRPVMEWLIHRGVARPLAVILPYLAILGLIAAILFMISGRLVTELAEIGNLLSTTYDRIWAEWPQGNQIQQALIRQLPSPGDLYQAITGEQGLAFAQTFLGVTSSSFTMVSQFLAVIVLSIYWTIDRVYFERVLLSLLPVEVRARWRVLWREIEHDLGAYIRSETAQSLLVLILLGIGFSWMGLPYPILLAVFGALAWLIPWLGAVMAVIPVFLAGELVGLPLAIGAAVYTAAVLLTMEVVVEPRLFARQQYSAWLSILMIMALGDAYGLLGVIIAPPLATVIQIILQRVFRPGSAALPVAPEIEAARQIAHLDERIGAIRRLIQQMSEKPSQQTDNLLERLDALVGRANQMTQEENEPAASAGQ